MAIAICRPSPIYHPARCYRQESLDDAIDSLEEAHSRVQEMLQTAENEYGAQLVDVELQEFGEDGTWSAVGRFYVEGPE